MRPILASARSLASCHGHAARVRLCALGLRAPKWPRNNELAMRRMLLVTPDQLREPAQPMYTSCIFLCKWEGLAFHKVGLRPRLASVLVTVQQLV